MSLISAHIELSAFALRCLTDLRSNFISDLDAQSSLSSLNKTNNVINIVNMYYIYIMNDCYIFYYMKRKKKNNNEI